MTLTEGTRERLFVPLVGRDSSEAPVVIVEVASYELASLAPAAL